MKKIFTFIAALLIAAGAWAQSAEPPTITLTTAKAVGETIKLSIDADPADQPNVWIDLNNNGVKDAGEAVTDFGNYKTYTLGAQTVTLHGKVTSLFCYDNQLTALDVSKNTALTELSCRDNQLTALDVSKNTSLRTLYCYKNSLTALDVSKNTSLHTLYCDKNSLTALDVSQNTALQLLSCHGNRLATLDISKNTKLWYLYCPDNQFTALDVSKNTGLYKLCCNGNQLTILDVSQNTALIQLECSGNQLTALDITNNKWLAGLDISNNRMEVQPLNALYAALPDITDIIVADWDTHWKKKLTVAGNPGAAASATRIATAKGWICDVQGAGAAEPTITLTTAKAVGETIKLSIDADPADQPNVWIDLNNNGVKDEGEAVITFVYLIPYTLGAKAVTLHGKVTSLFCYDNQLTALDVSKNTALTELSCRDNQLTALDVSKNTSLRTLYCYGNRLTTLDLSKNATLEYLKCSGNQLTELDVSQNTTLKFLYCYNNSLTKLNVSQNTALTRLDCFNNQLTALDVSKSTSLNTLYCDKNSLTALDVSKNTALSRLGCGSNRLTALDVSKNMGLQLLECSGNQLTTLDITNNKQLVDLNISNNRMEVQPLNTLYAALPDITNVTVEDWEKTWKKKLTVAGNPGAAASATQTATAKGWIVDIVTYPEVIAPVIILKTENGATEKPAATLKVTVEFPAGKDEVNVFVDWGNGSLQQYVIKRTDTGLSPIGMYRAKAQDVSITTELKGQLLGTEVKVFGFGIKEVSCEANQVTGITVTPRAELASINCSGNNMDACALDAMYRSLKTVSAGTINNDNNPGAATSNTTLATDKGWTVSTSGDGTGCESSTSVTPVTVGQPMILSPNPARHRVNIVFASTVTAAEVVIVDVTGKIMMTRPFAQTLTIDVSALPKGIYLVRAGAAGGKLMVE